MEKNNEKIMSFIENANSQVKSSKEGDYKMGNKSYKKIIQIGVFFKEKGELFYIENLLDNESLGVRLWASTLMLHYSPDKAQDGLKSIIDEKAEHLSFTAKITLDEFLKGNLDPLI